MNYIVYSNTRTKKYIKKIYYSVANDLIVK